MYRRFSLPQESKSTIANPDFMYLGSDCGPIITGRYRSSSINVYRFHTARLKGAYRANRKPSFFQRRKQLRRLGLWLAALLFAVPCLAQSNAGTAPVVSTTSDGTFSVSSTVVALPILGQTVAANETGAVKSITPQLSIRSTTMLTSEGVQAYVGGPQYTFSLDKYLAKTTLSTQHFELSVHGAAGAIETPSGQHITEMVETALHWSPIAGGSFSLVGGVQGWNLVGAGGWKPAIILGPKVSW